MDAEITLRRLDPEDEAFLFDLYATTRVAELACHGWDECQRMAFLRMQFAAQQAHFRMHHPEASWQVILVGGKRAGRLYVERRQDEIYVIDVALLPKYRTGIGRAVLRDLLAEAAGKGLPVTGHVEIRNPALRLFQRMGFKVLERVGPHYYVRWRVNVEGEAGTT